MKNYKKTIETIEDLEKVVSKTESEYMNEIQKRLGKMPISIILSLALLPEYYGGKRAENNTLEFPDSSLGYKLLSSVPHQHSKSISQELLESGLVRIQVKKDNYIIDSFYPIALKILSTKYKMQHIQVYYYYFFFIIISNLICL